MKKNHMRKYPISKEFFPFFCFTPPISEKFLAMAVSNMKMPKFIYKGKEVDVTRIGIGGDSAVSTLAVGVCMMMVFYMQKNFVRQGLMLL